MNALAAVIVAEATGEAPLDEAGKNPAAVALRWPGGKKGEPARTKKLTAAERHEIAKKAAETRWRSAR